MPIAYNPIGNDAWSSLVKTSPVDCRRGCLGIPHVKFDSKGLLCGAVAAFIFRRTPAHTVAIVGGDGLAIAVDGCNGAAGNRIY